MLHVSGFYNNYAYIITDLLDFMPVMLTVLSQQPCQCILRTA